MTKATYDKGRESTIVYKVDGVQPNFHKAPFGRQLDDLRKIQKFINDPNTKDHYIGCKGKANFATVKEWIKEHQPTQFYAKWKTDSTFCKDDSVRIYYT